MRPTRRCWTIAGVGAVVLVVAILGQKPLALAGAASFGAFCLVSSVHAVSAFTKTQDALSVDIKAIPTRVAVNGDTTLSVTVSLETPKSTSVGIDCEFPPGISSDPLRVTVAPGESKARELASPTFPVAGRFHLPEVTCTFTDAAGLFTQQVSLDDQVTITAQPYTPDDVYVKVDGERVTTGIGTNFSDDRATELGNVDSIREYLPGDSIQQIDWKSTARLDELYVREFEAEPEVETRIIIDARSQIADGETGRTKLHVFREVALALVRSVNQTGDPLGLTILDDTGVRLVTGMANTMEHYRQVHDELLTLGTDQEENTRTSTWSKAVKAGPTEAHLATRRLAGREESPTRFVTMLRPFFARTGSYVERLSDDPVFDVIRRHIHERSLGTWIVLFTDDMNRTSVEETAKLATRHGGRVSIFLTPTFLFEHASLADLESAYEQLIAFEEFRNRLEQIPRITAYEVGPNERVQAVLAGGRTRGKGRKQAHRDSWSH